MSISLFGMRTSVLFACNLGVISLLSLTAPVHPILWGDVLFWCLVIFVAAYFQTRLGSLVFNHADIAIIAAYAILPLWLLPLIVFGVMGILQFVPQRAPSWSNLLIYTTSASAGGVVYAMLHANRATIADDFTLLLTNLAVAGVYLLCKLIPYAWQTTELLFGAFIRDSGGMLLLWHVLYAVLALFLTKLYLVPVVGTWGGWGVIMMSLPWFYTNYRRFCTVEDHYSSLIQRLPVGIYRVNSSGRFLQANPALAEMLKFESAEELMHTNIRDLYPEPDVYQMIRQDQQAQADTVTNEVMMCCKDGEPIWVRDIARVRLNERGEIEYVDGTLQDISIHKTFETALQANNELIKRAKQEWEATVDSLPASVCLLDREGRILRTNRVLGNWGLVSIRTARGRTLTEIMEPEYGQYDFAGAFAAAWATIEQQPLATFQIGDVSRERYLLVQLTSVSDTTFSSARSAESYAVAVIRDITTQKLIEQELRSLNAKLEERVRERTAQLEKVNEQLHVQLEREKELNAFRSRFGSMISHEFRTPLSVIQVSGQLLERYGERMTSTQRKEIPGRIKQQVTHLTNLLDDILLISRSETIGVEMVMEAVPVGELFSRICQETSQLYWQDHQLDLIDDIGGRTIIADEKQLRQAFTNLLSNAVKYSSAGDTVTCRLWFEGQTACIAISDEGIGIPSEAIAHIFDVFYRADNVGAISGTGLGLALVKLVAENHNGSIDVESTPDQGTTFTLRFPSL
jgi:PAS domain S-box-containing protein